MSLRFDHAIILVHDLDLAIAQYRAKGFNAFFGGKHADGKTHNALIVFADGSYLELLAPTSSELLKGIDLNDRTSFLFLLTQGEGLGGYALLSDGLEADVEAMQRLGLGVVLSSPNGRARPDGQQIRWRTAALDDGTMTPFFIQDQTPRVLRVPDEPSVTAQPNGVTGVARLEIGVPELADGVRDYEMMTGLSVEQGANQAQFTLNGVEFVIKANTATTVRGQLLDVQLKASSSETISLNKLMAN
ncbi:MAG: VOC family protein [Anaerolineae bacterium]|nr:VOC family protein [Anaerolineae bacterium]